MIVIIFVRNGVNFLKWNCLFWYLKCFMFILVLFGFGCIIVNIFFLVFLGVIKVFR